MRFYVFFIIGIICGLISFLIGFHYRYITVKYKRDYKNYFRLIMWFRYISLIFVIIGVVMFFIEGIFY